MEGHVEFLHEVVLLVKKLQPGDAKTIIAPVRDRKPDGPNRNRVSKTANVRG